jgi:thiamine transport system substrate-binding protein
MKQAYVLVYQNLTAPAIYLLLTLAVILTACTPISTTPTPAAELRRLTVMTHDSFAVSEAVIQQFEQANNVEVSFLLSGDAGTALNKAILAKNAPLADVFYGVDNTFLSRALSEDIFEPYNSPLLAEIPAAFKLDPQQRALPVDYGDVCLNYDRAYFEGQSLQPPGSLADLLKAEYKSLLVVENPVTSSPGLAFLLATIAQFGEDGYLDFWRGLVDNDVKIVNDWNTAYYTEFTRAGGTRPLVVSYNSSPVFELIYTEPQQGTATPSQPPTAAIVSDGSCFRQVEFAGILKDTSNRDLAEKWIDFMLSPAFQEDMPLQMFVFPVNPQAELAPAFVEHLQVPINPASLDPGTIAEGRDDWLQSWTEVVLR